MTEQEFLGQTKRCWPDPLDHAARLAEITDRMRTCLQELDRLQLWKAGAHLTLAIATLEVER